MPGERLPAPESAELEELLQTKLHRAIYWVLYERREDPPTMQEVRAAVAAELGAEAASQVHFSKRLRELRDHFVIPHPSARDGYTYKLAGRRAVSKDEPKISKTLAAKIRRHGRCAMCGKTAAEDRVRIHIDHKVPREWGGKTQEDNLQPLCSDCNEGKQAYFASFDQYSSEIRQAASHEEPHRRIGELLRAFGGKDVPEDLLELVASSRQYQADWQKRLRELRVLGWKIGVTRRKEGQRVRVYYRLDEDAPPWPAGAIRAEITRRERLKQAAER